MTAPALDFAFLAGDQFLYPTYGAHYDQEYGAAGADTHAEEIIDVPTQPLRLRRLASAKHGRYLFSNADLSTDEFFPSSTKSLSLFDLLKVDGARSVVDHASSAERELMDFKRYPENWDGFGSSAPKSELVDRAIHVLRNFPGALPVPEPTLTSDGTIALDVLDEDYRSICTVEITSEARAIYTISTPEGVVVDVFGFDGDSDMIAALGRISQTLS
jgi:hypothetical protein